MTDEIECRIGCGACCIVPAIPGPYENHPEGKPAGERCRNLTDDNRCRIWSRRPDACRNFVPRRSYCGASDAEAFYHLARLAAQKRPIPLALNVIR